ncbi:hypothetical protein LTR03_016510, partial [Friedmanniomyces endolithicus]
ALPSSTQINRNGSHRFHRQPAAELQARHRVRLHRVVQARHRVRLHHPVQAGHRVRLRHHVQAGHRVRLHRAEPRV